MIEHAAATWLVNALWIVPLMASATALCVRFGRLGPRSRHGAWVAALVLAVILPALPAALPPYLGALAAPSGAVASRTFQPSAVTPPVDAERAATVVGRAAVESTPPADPLPYLVFDLAWTRAALCLAGLAAAIALCRLLVAVRAGDELVRAARPGDLDPALRGMLSLVAAGHARRLPPILECPPRGGAGSERGKDHGVQRDTPRSGRTAGQSERHLARRQRQDPCRGRRRHGRSRPGRGAVTIAGVPRRHRRGRPPDGARRRRGPSRRCEGLRLDSGVFDSPRPRGGLVPAQLAAPSARSLTVVSPGPGPEESLAATTTMAGRTTRPNRS